MNKSVLLAFPAIFLLAGCGGSSSSQSVVIQTTPYAGSYAANLTSPANSALLVVLQSDGSATVVIAGSTGVLGYGSGTVSGKTLSVKATGSGGTYQVGTTFNSSSSAVSQISGSATDTNISDGLIAGAGKSPFVGNYSASFTGSNTGTASMLITANGGVSGSGKVNGGATASFTGSSQVTGLISFTGSVDISGTTVKSTFSGSLYVSQIEDVGPRIMGNGTWKDPSGGTGTWTASNIIG